MISASLEIQGQEYIVDWTEPSIDLFHQINRIIDLEGAEQYQTVYFTRREFRNVRGWLTGFPNLVIGNIDSWIITIVLDGYELTLKVKEDE